MPDIALRGELWDNDSADVLRWWGWKDITCPGDIAAALGAAGGDDVTLLINSPGGSMVVGSEIRSMLRRYAGKTEALFQGYGASAATLAASGCKLIRSEPGSLLCYHNPSGSAEGDFHEMDSASEGLKNARDCILEIYSARKGCKPKAELQALMDKNTWISPTQALEYGLIDEIVPLSDGMSESDTGAMLVASAGGYIRLTSAMRAKYHEHVAADAAAAAEKAAADKKATRALARARVLANY